ncbi:MAG: TraB/GumN family protein [Maricaulaceae bacterium]
MLRSRLKFNAVLASALCALFGFGGPAQAQDGEPAIWTVKDRDTEITLFGTVHVLDPALEWMSEDMTEALNAAQTVYFEAPVDGANAPEVQALIGELGLNPPGVTLSSLLSEQGLEDFQIVAGRLGAPTTQLEGFRPWFASLLLAVQNIIASGGQPDAGADRLIHAQVGEDQTKRYFETAEFQLRLFAGLSGDQEVEAFEATLAELKDNPDFLNDIVDLWRTGDAAAVGDLLTESAQEAPGVYDLVFTQRNQAWAEALADVMEMETGEIFVAVGAGHLAGADSVQALMCEKGYKVRRVNGPRRVRGSVCR